MTKLIVVIDKDHLQDTMQWLEAAQEEFELLGIYCLDGAFEGGGVETLRTYWKSEIWNMIIYYRIVGYLMKPMRCLRKLPEIEIKS